MGTMTDNLVKNVETSLRRVQDPTNNTAIEIGKFKDAVKNEGSEIDEKWSKKYKDSIDCSNPKGFSQKAHCQGKKKDTNVDEEVEDDLKENFSKQRKLTLEMFERFNKYN